MRPAVEQIGRSAWATLSDRPRGPATGHPPAPSETLHRFRPEAGLSTPDTPPWNYLRHMTAPALELKNIGKSYYGVSVLEDVNLEVRPGEIHALVGENGAGPP